MDSLCNLLLAALLLLAAFFGETEADAMVTGTVFCDRCKDGQISVLDYPIYGMKVTIACQDSNGQITTWKEETTNWLGSYTVRFDGSPDLSSCKAQLSGSSQGSSDCGAIAGPPQQLRLMFRMFDMEMYAVDSLLTQPAKPMSFCPTSSPSPAQPKPVPTPSPPSPPATTPPPHPPSASPPPPPPPPPSIPFMEASACPYWNWTMPEYRCHWRVVQPDTKVAVAFGLVAARKYGNDMNLRQALEGRGDVYRTLLREATTALLNSYNSIWFGYPTVSVVYHTNSALLGSQRQALLVALRFMRANSGYGTVQCRFSTCK